MKLLQALVHLGERQFESERRAGDLILDILQNLGIPYSIHHFSVRLPFCKKAVLQADGKNIECMGCAFIGGMIEGKDNVVSNTMPSIYFQDKPNISFNPSCAAISRGNYYFAPSVAINQKGLMTICAAKKIHGKVDVELRRHSSRNILVGNSTNPHTICFAHYDSLGPGAVDNASGVSVLMQVLTDHPEFLHAHLFVFAGCEELSTDKPFYWGFGFRTLQKKYPDLFNKAKKILVVDSVGNGHPSLLTEQGIISRAFPINNLSRLAHKITLIVGDIEHLMSVYHSKNDDGRGIKASYLKETSQRIAKILTESSLERNIRL